MAVITAPTQLEALVEKHVRTLLAAALTAVPAERIFTSRAREDAKGGNLAAVTVVLERGDMDPPRSGWYDCTLTVEFDPRGLSNDQADAAFAEIEGVLGNENGAIETELTTADFKTASGSVDYDGENEIREDRRRTYSLTASMGLL